MTTKQIVVIALIFCACGFAFGHHVGTTQQSKINIQLKEEYNELKQNYDILETQYKKDLESCYIQLERYERGSISE